MNIKPVGAPQKPMRFPTNQSFTVTELSMINPKLTKMSIHLKLKKQIVLGNIERAGLKMNPVGRPAIIFSKKDFQVSDQ